MTIKYIIQEAHGSDGSHLPSSLEILNAQAGDEIDLVVASNPYNTYAYPFNVSGYIVDATNSQTFAVQQPALTNVPKVAGDYFNFGMGSENSFWIDAGMDFSEVDIEITLSNGQAYNAGDYNTSESLTGTYTLRQQPLDLNDEVTEMETTTFTNTSVVNDLRELVCNLFI